MTAPGSRSRPFDLGDLGLALLALGCAGALALSSLRHSGSLAFPIDDGYIYSNYVANAAQGHFFTYNPGETSGGVTSLAWYLLSLLSYVLTAPLHGLLEGIAPPSVHALAGGEDIAAQAGHLYVAAYVPGALLLAATAVGARRLAEFALPAEPNTPRARAALCWLIGAVVAADLGLVWGAMSGLEVSLSAALVVWLLVALLCETESGTLRWSLVLGALLPLARPELMVFGGVGLLWLLVRARTWRDAARRRHALWQAAMFGLVLAAGLALMALIYWLGWGRPLPSSFYAKVGALRTGERFFSATAELVAAGRWLPFVAGAAALLGSAAVLLSRQSEIVSPERARVRHAAGLLLMAVMAFVASVMATLPWFGQEDRYLLPVHPLVIVQIGTLVGLLFSLARREILPRGPRVQQVGSAAFILLLVLATYLWGTRQYAVQVRNIEDGHVRPALWVAANTPPGSVLAAEPIGAARLFSVRRTVDLVGLTTPATLGTYGNWPRAWAALRKAGADHLLYYPAWFGSGDRPGGWATVAALFDIPDNRIVGDERIAVYRLDWRLYPGP